MKVNNISDLTLALIAEGAYPAKLAFLRRVGSFFGLRIALYLELQDNKPTCTLLTATAVPSSSPKGKLADMLRGWALQPPSRRLCRTGS